MAHDKIPVCCVSHLKSATFVRCHDQSDRTWVVALQQTTYAISGKEFLHGLSFQLPDTGDWKGALVTAFATFGIIGVGATELISYPYWCLKKGNSRSVGPRTADASWVRRAIRDTRSSGNRPIGLVLENVIRKATAVCWFSMHNQQFCLTLSRRRRLPVTPSPAAFEVAHFG